MHAPRTIKYLPTCSSFYVYANINTNENMCSLLQCKFGIHFHAVLRPETKMFEIIANMKLFDFNKIIPHMRGFKIPHFSSKIKYRINFL